MAGWAKFNENNPWGRDGIAITGKTISDGAELHAAIKAVQNHTATPAQQAIVQGTDTMIQQIASTRRRDPNA